MATVSGTALPNTAFPITALGAGGSARPSTVRNTIGLSTATSAFGANAPANQSTPALPSVFTARDTGTDSQNGFRLAGDNGALLDLSTSLTAQEAAGTEEAEEPADPDGLTDEEEEQVAELKQADQEVRRHEAAHAAAGGAFAGAPTFTFERGPDGQLYAVAGEVSIDTAPVDGDPAATIQKLQIVRSAALAPAEPSAQDRAVAAQAQAGIRQAQAELQTERTEELTGEGGDEDELAPTREPGAANESAAASGQNGSAPQGLELFGARSGEADRANDASDLAARIIDIAI